MYVRLKIYNNDLVIVYLQDTDKVANPGSEFYELPEEVPLMANPEHTDEQLKQAVAKKISAESVIPHEVLARQQDAHRTYEMTIYGI